MRHCIVLTSILLATAPAHAQSLEPGKQWVVLIAIKKHHDDALNLSFTVADAEKLKQVLVERAGVPASQILEMTDAAAKDKQPTLANLRRTLPAFLSQAKAEDRVLLFFAGHGFLHEGKTYLLPSDGDKNNLAKTALASAEVREALSQCHAKVKFLILDCCHSGGARRIPQDNVQPEGLARSLNLQQTPGIVILASCKDKESSWEWNERRQGVFSYWLCRALEGAADKDNDGRLGADEVYDYTHERVSRTASVEFGRTQTPVRIIGQDVAGVPTVLTLRPESPETLCRRLAEHLDLEVRARKLKKVGVLEFLAPLGRVEGLAAANLPAYCARQVHKALTDLGGTSYTVLGDDEFKGAVRGFGLSQLGDPSAMRKLGAKAGGIEALVTGTLRQRALKLHVQCELVATADGSSLVHPSGVLPISEELLGDYGASFDNFQRPAGKPHDKHVVEHILLQAQQGHPLLKKDFPFKLDVLGIQAKRFEDITDDSPRKIKEHIAPPVEDDKEGVEKRHLLIAARENEFFEIKIVNNYPQRVAMTLLVDGFNTLGKGRERLDVKTRYWVLDQGKDYTIPGFFLSKKNQAKEGELFETVGTRFQFVDVSRSLAGRQNFGDAIGLITAAFYAEHGRALGVGEGPEEKRYLEKSNFRAGRLLSVIHLRYVDEREVGTGVIK